MKKVFFIILLLSSICFANGQLLWEISGKGIKKSYIFGTNHLVSADFLDSMPNVYAAYNSSQIVVGEVLLSAKNISDTIIAYASLPKNISQNELWTEEEFAEIDVALQNTLFFSLKDVAMFKPSIISAMYMQAVYEKIYKKKEDFLIDTYFQHIAEMSEKEVTALESVTEQSALLFGNQTLNRQKEILLATIRDSATLVQDIKKTVNLYKNGNIDLLYSEYINDTSKIALTLQEKHDLLDNRNIKWAKKIAEITKKKSAFIAVGALHLSGENGLIALLKKMGYKVKKA